MSPHATYCPQHGIIPNHQHAAHRRLHQQQTDQQRATHEPWRNIYTKPQWKQARQRVLARDDQCRAIEHGERCTNTDNLQIHHTTPLRHLWDQAKDDPAIFTVTACDPNTLIAICPNHHRKLEAQQRRR